MSKPSLTVAFFTGRQQPHLDWAWQSLNHTMMRASLPTRVELLVVDALGRGFSEFLDLAECDALPRAMLSHTTFVKPKPTIWQGEHRVTKQDWWSMSNSRNTALVHCKTDWIACLDDRCVLTPTWMEAVLDAMAGNYAVAGAYEKRHGMTYSRDVDEMLKSGTLVSQDNRFEMAPHGYKRATGNWLYGCTFALPLECALEVNGFEEGCDGLSAEDYIFGMNLYNAGYRLDYDVRMKIVEDRSPESDPGSSRFKRSDKGVSPNDKSHAALARFGPRRRTEFTPDLRELRALIAAGNPLPTPAPDAKDWYDGQPISEL